MQSLRETSNTAEPFRGYGTNSARNWQHINLTTVVCMYVYSFIKKLT